MRPASVRRHTKLGRGVESRHFPLSVRLVETDEVFPLENIGLSTTIGELKSYLEYATGVPVFMQRLHYLDEGDLQETTDIRSNDIVPGACLHMNVWHTWSKLLIAAALGDADEVFSLGVTTTSDYRTPNSEYMSTKTRQSWLKERAFVALYVASHRGHVKLVQRLIESGANVNGKTTLGRTPLHVAAARDRGDIVDILLNCGADVNALDSFDESALDVAEKFGHKDGARHLFLFQWQVRAANARKGPEHPLFLHQLCDTSFPIWHNGTQGQLYFAQVLPPGEFSGTGLGAKRRLPLSPIAAATAQAEGSGGEEADIPPESWPPEGSPGKAADLKGKKMAFEEWLKRKQKIEQVRLDQLKAEEELKKLEEAKKKEQSLIDKESYETWIKKQQEEKSSQEKAEKKKAAAAAAAKKQQLQAGAQRSKAGGVAAGGGAAASGGILTAGNGPQLATELETVDAHREVQELKRFIERKWKTAAVTTASHNNSVGGATAADEDYGVDGGKPDWEARTSVAPTVTAASGASALSKATGTAASKKKLRS